ncbi:DUF2157 domain-containing protein [Nocardia sp. CA-290969]|uniref:DUF2157 domain-containing protein n=1 Tax=Nocardia sp. CA-290969 TaxID=3239986 RepID=UPI003D8C7DA5
MAEKDSAPEASQQVPRGESRTGQSEPDRPISAAPPAGDSGASGRKPAFRAGKGKRGRSSGADGPETETVESTKPVTGGGLPAVPGPRQTAVTGSGGALRPGAEGTGPGAQQSAGTSGGAHGAEGTGPVGIGSGSASEGKPGNVPGQAPPALVDLVRRGVLDENQLGAVVTALAQEHPRPTPARLLAEIAAYAGAGLLLSGLVLILAESWDDMAKLGRFVLFVLVALGLTVAGVATAGGRRVLFRPAWRLLPAAGHTARTRLAAVLFALAAVSIAAAAGAVFDDGNVSTDRTWVYAAVAGLLAAVAGYAALPSLLGLLLCAGFSVAAVHGVLGEFLAVDGDLTGLGVLALGLGWLGITRLGAVLDRWAGYVVGVVVAVTGAQTVDVFDQMRLAYVLTAVVAVVCFALYATDRSWVLSLGGAAALTLAAVEAVADWTGESAGASGAILVVGAVVLGIGSYLLTRSAKKSVQI